MSNVSEPPMGAKELIDILIPEHTRTSCSDEKPYNGISEDDITDARCSRCMLLDILSGKVSPTRFKELSKSVTFYVAHIEGYGQ